MSAKNKKNGPLVISDEHNEVKIYTVKGRAGSLYQLSYYRAGERQRRTFADLNEAKREARMQLGLLAGERIQARNLSAMEMESYVIATRTLEPTGLPLHVCAELFAEASRVLNGRSIVEAAKYYMRHYDPQRPRKPLRELADEFVASRQASGVTDKYVKTARWTMKMLVDGFGGTPLDEITSAALDQWMESHRHLSNRSRNSYRVIVVSFGNFLKKRGYLPAGKPTAFDGMNVWKNELKPVTIYTPEEMQRLLNSARPTLLPYMAIGAFAGLRNAEISRLDWSQIRFDRGFIECDASMTKTRSRRLVPISDNLRAWLEPIALPQGRIVRHFDMGSAICEYSRRWIGLTWRRNALRHSYISYRLALVPDTARVALECGNSPDMIFKHYRELVLPAQAEQWFKILPPAGYPQCLSAHQKTTVGTKHMRKLKPLELAEPESRAA
jgi:integrase